jgi:nucleotide-binding universal stress UspA family protein
LYAKGVSDLGSVMNARSGQSVHDEGEGAGADMTSYLVVAHQTAASRALAETLQLIAADDPEASFVLLVPATPVEQLVIPDEGEAEEIAQRRCEAAVEFLEAQGVPVLEKCIGKPLPLEAIREELGRDAFAYDAIVISTFPAEQSRWLQANLVDETEKAFGLRVIHVLVEPPARIRPSHVQIRRRTSDSP